MSAGASVARIGQARPMGTSSVEDAADALADRRPVLVTGDDGEVSMIAAASMANVALLTFMVRHTSGFICVALPEPECERLVLAPIQATSTAGARDQFRVTVDAAHGIGTGISARDRARTAVLLADPNSGPTDFRRPGHVVPLAVRAGGVLEHPGHAEAGIDLAGVADLVPAVVMARMVSTAAPERMATYQEVVGFGADRGIPILDVTTLQEYRGARQPPVTRMADTTIPLWAGTAHALGYRGMDGSEFLVLVVGSTSGKHVVPVYVHRECVIGDVFGPLRCDCGHRLDRTRRAILNGGGVLIYCRASAVSAGTFGSGDRPCRADLDRAATDVDAAREQILRDLGVLSSLPCTPADGVEPSTHLQCASGSGSYLAGGF